MSVNLKASENEVNNLQGNVFIWVTNHIKVD